MKNFIKNRLRKRLLEYDNQNNITLPPDVLKNIELQVNKEYNEEQSKLTHLNNTIEAIKSAISKSSDESQINFYRGILNTQEQTLKNIHPHSKEELRKYYTDHTIKQVRQNKERNDYKQQREKEGINKQNIIDLFVTALEGGSNHWYNINTLPNNVKSSEDIGEHILNGGYIQFFDIENPKELLGDVDMNSLLDGISLLKTQYPNEYENILMDEYDANDADVFLQLCVMGEVVFG